MADIRATLCMHKKSLKIIISAYQITTCGATGRYGPTQENCTVAYNNTNVKVQVLNSPGISGIQKWVVPNEGFYT